MTGDEFTRRIDALRPTLYRVCRAQLSSAADREDAVQEAVLRAWQKRNSLKDERYFGTWFIRILINECHNLQRQRRRLLAMETPPERPSPQGDDAARLNDALAALEEKQRMCVLLHYIEGYSVKETARMLGIGESAAKARLMRGRRQLKELLSEEVFGE